MRFELTVALKYLIPRWRQLSVSIISLISILVISLVVWLVVLFLSVTEGIEKKWIEQLVTLNAPVQMVPTEAYYRSYYYQIDGVSLDSDYASKTIGEKLATAQSDPYDPLVDVELPYDFPTPDRRSDGSLKDPVKEGWEAISSLDLQGIRSQEYEISFGNLHINLLREGVTPHEMQKIVLSQVSYIAAHDAYNTRLKQLILPLSVDDYNNLLNAFATEESAQFIKQSLEAFFNHIAITQLRTTDQGFVLNPSFFPHTGTLKGVGVIRHNEIQRVVIPQEIQELEELTARLHAFGMETTDVEVVFDEKHMHLLSDQLVAANAQLILNDRISFYSELIPSSLQSATALYALQFDIHTTIQGISLSGKTPYEQLEIAEIRPLEAAIHAAAPAWLCTDDTGCTEIPCDQTLGDGILIAKHFQNNGVRVGDCGYFAYYTPTASSTQEQRIPVYVAGFYDPGMMPVGNKLIFVNPKVVALLRGNTPVSDTMLGNGVNIWLEDITQAEAVKSQLIQGLDARGISKYWKVQSFHDYDFAKPVLQQLRSDKHLFTLIAVVILIVACSNIISMLILLVNDKKREIGILQSMGASPKRIATIFGICGFVMGIISCCIGTTIAILTLRYLQSLVNFLGFLQGHDVFQAAFYGSHLPNELSFSSLLFVIVSTMIISFLAGIVPAIKAARIRPSEILRAE